MIVYWSGRTNVVSLVDEVSGVRAYADGVR
jgi:hypothetical protein